MSDSAVLEDIVEGWRKRGPQLDTYFYVWSPSRTEVFRRPYESSIIPRFVELNCGGQFFRLQWNDRRRETRDVQLKVDRTSQLGYTIVQCIHSTWAVVVTLICH